MAVDVSAAMVSAKYKTGNNRNGCAYWVQGIEFQPELYPPQSRHFHNINIAFVNFYWRGSPKDALQNSAAC